MRLFIAIDLDDDVRSAIAAEQERLKAALRESSRSAIKWIRPEQMHLTLVFLGEMDEARATPLVDDVHRGVAQPPFEIVFGDIGVFPPRGAPNVLWIGVASGAEGALALQRELADRVSGSGVPLERRPFHPHLTLARWRESRAADRQSVLTASRRNVATLRVDHATLYQSRLSSAGPSYTALARADLSYP